MLKPPSCTRQQVYRNNNLIFIELRQVKIVNIVYIVINFIQRKGIFLQYFLSTTLL